MKGMFLAAGVMVCAVTSSSASADEAQVVKDAEKAPTGVDARPLDALSVDLGRLAFQNRISFQYERAVTDVTDAYIGAGVILGLVQRPYDGVLAGDWGFDFELGMRFFFFKEAPRGFFLGPLATVGYTFKPGKVESRSGYSVGLGAMVGYSFFIGAFDISIGAGGQVHAEHLQDGANPSDSPAAGVIPILPMARVAVGYGF